MILSLERLPLTRVILILISAATAGVGLISQALYASFFGTDIAYELYLTAFAAPAAVAGILGQIVSYSWTSEFVRTNQAPSDAPRFRWAALILAVLIIVVFTPIAIFFGHATISNNDRFINQAFLGTKLTAIMWGVLALSVISGVLQAAFAADGRFVRAAFIGLILPLSTCVGLAMYSNHGILAVSYVQLFGAFIAFLTCLIFIRAHFQIGGVTSRQIMSALKLLKSAIPTAVSISLFLAYGPIDAWVSPNYQQGDYAVLGYAQRLVIGVGALVVAAIGTISSVEIAQGMEINRDQANLSTIKNVSMCVYWSSALMPAIIFAGYVWKPLIADYTKLGVGSADLLFVAMLAYAIAMPAWIGTSTIYRAFFAMRRFWEPAIISISWILLYGVITLAVTKYYGAPGTIWTFAVLAYLVYVCALLVVVTDGKPFLFLTLRQGALGAAAGTLPCTLGGLIFAYSKGTYATLFSVVLLSIFVAIIWLILTYRIDKLRNKQFSRYARLL
jgi:putative peptidoglycan lipid II flippase